MKFLGIIPARSGSQTIKNKNLKTFNNKPLIYWTIKAAKNSKYLNHFILFIAIHKFNFIVGISRFHLDMN